MRRSCALFALAVTLMIAQDASDPNVTPPRLSNKKRVEPQCTEKAIRGHISGLVKLRAVVGIDGHVRDVEVVRSLGYGLDENAVDAVRRWEFQPALKDGTPVEATVPIECQFGCN
jgi:TonB family protein